MVSSKFFSVFGQIELVALIVVILFDVLSIYFFAKRYMLGFVLVSMKNIDRVRLPMTFPKNDTIISQDLKIFWDHHSNKIWFRLRWPLFLVAPFVIGNWHLSNDRRTIIKENIRLSYFIPVVIASCVAAICSFYLLDSILYNGHILPLIIAMIFFASNIVFMISRLRIASSFCLEEFSELTD